MPAKTPGSLLLSDGPRSVQTLEKDLRECVKTWNDTPQSLLRTKVGEEILAPLGRLLQRICRLGQYQLERDERALALVTRSRR